MSVTIQPLKDPGGWYALRARRYLLAGIGPVTLAGTHFAISFTMLRLDEPVAFGIFIFLFVAAQFTVGLSAALFGAPLQALNASRDAAERDRAAGAIITAAVLMAIVAAILFGLLALAMGIWTRAAIWYGLYTALMILRWVGRAWSYAADRPLHAAISDVSYGVVTLGAFGFWALYLGVVPESACYGALALGAAVSLVAFGRGYAALLFARPRPASLQLYRGIWRSQSRWALLGVVTMEAVANAHVYMVTVFAGVTAMAPLAAAALILRPINVVQNALVDFERPQMARLIADRSLLELRRTKQLFLGVLLAVWLGSATVALGIIHFAPWIVFSADYDLTVVTIATYGWVVVTLLVLLQVPSSVMLQAAGDFDRLARATVRSSIVSIVGVALTLWLFDPVWTIAAMALGWMVDLALVRRAAAARWRSLDTASAPRL